MNIIEKLGITPGPWTMEKGESQHCPGKERVESIRTRAFGKSDMMGDYRGCIVVDFTEAHGERPHAFSEAENNARLITAAPEMLEMLIEMTEFYQEVNIRTHRQEAIIESATGRTLKEIKKMGVEE